MRTAMTSAGSTAMTSPKVARSSSDSEPSKAQASSGPDYGEHSGLATLISDIHRSSHKRWSRQVAADVVCAVDVALIMLASFVPAMIYAKTYIAKSAPTPWLAILQTGFIAAIIACGALRNWGMYDPARVHDFPAHPGRLLAALGLSFIAVLGLGNPFAASHPMLWIWYAAWASASFTLLLGNRLLVRALLRHWTAAGRFETRVAVFGAGTIARRVRDHLADPALGLRFVGVYDDRVDDSRVTPEGLTVTGRLDTLIKAARLGRVDKIIVALPQSADSRATAVLRKLDALPVSVHMVTHIASDLLSVGSGRQASHRVSNLGPVGLIDVKDRPLAGWSPLLKRTEDYVLGLALLVISLPLLALIAALTKLDSLGPVLVAERRRGLDAQVFRLWRFRTTHVDLDGRVIEVARHDATGDAADHTDATPDDATAVPNPNITRLGRWLRATGLDKLPQLFNVLLGDMSLVGPTPYGLMEPCRYAQMLEDHANRYRVRPGMTGPSQRSLLRSANRPSPVRSADATDATTPDALRARIDSEMAHISHWSLGRDLRVLGGALFR
jgi:lipopolysaccharide/colanic/teichoic acid biosynthesis glycosyltransferase